MSIVALLREYTTKLTLTNDNMYPDIIDQVHREVPYLYWMANRARAGGIMFERGGTKLKMNIVHAENTNRKAYYGSDTLPVGETDEITAGFEVWRSNATMIQITLDEMLENYGEEGIIKIAPAKYQVALMGMYGDVHRQLVQGTVGGASAPTFQRFIAADKELLPLGFLVQKSFNNADKVHELDQTTQTFFRNKVFLSAATTLTGFRKEMRNVTHQASFGSTLDAPDLGLCTQEYYELIESAIDDRRRYGDTEAAELGYEAIRLGPTTYMIDSKVPDFGATAADTVALAPAATRAACIGINTNWMQLVVHELAYFQPTPWVEAINQTAIYSKIILKASHRCTQRRKQYLHHNVDGTIVTP